MLDIEKKNTFSTQLTTKVHLVRARTEDSSSWLKIPYNSSAISAPQRLCEKKMRLTYKINKEPAQ